MGEEPLSDEGKGQDYLSFVEPSAGFSENISPPADCLVGKQMELFNESGKKAKITFLDIEPPKRETEEQNHKEKFMWSYTLIMPRERTYISDKNSFWDKLSIRRR